MAGGGAVGFSSSRNWKLGIFSSICNCCSFCWERGVSLGVEFRVGGLSVGEGLDDDDTGRCCFHPTGEGLDDEDKGCCCLHPTGEVLEKNGSC